MSPSSLVQKILQIEKKHNLFDMHFKNINFYHLIRMQIYYYLIGEKKIYSKQNFKQKNYIKTLLLIIKEIFSFHQRNKLIKNNICIVRHSRNIDGIDIYTNYLKNIFEKYTILHTTAGINFNLDKKSINYDYILFKKKLLSLFGISYLNKDSQVKQFIKIFKENFLLDSTFEKFVYSQIQNQLNSYLEAKKFLKKSNFKIIIVVNSYGNLGLIYAANELRLDTIEIQHGSINKYHLGYHFPYVKKNSIKSFPKKMILFGNFWKFKANFPIPYNNIFSLGSPYFEEKIKNFTFKKPNKINKILVISQQTTHTFIIKFLKDTISNNNNLQFTYKAHPKEDLDLVKKLLTKYRINKNVQIISGNHDIYSLFKNHNVQIGVFSTSLYEGYSFKLKTGIIQVPGWENMKDLLKYPNTHLIKNYKDLNKLLIFKPKNFSFDFFKSNAKKNYKKFFNNL